MARWRAQDSLPGEVQRDRWLTRVEAERLISACAPHLAWLVRFALRHTWASWHRQAGTSCDELKDLGGWKSRSMVHCYAKFVTDNLRVAVMRIESKRERT